MTADMRYLPIPGTHGWRDRWWSSDDHPFAQLLRAEQFSPLRHADGRPYRCWSTDLAGVLFGARERDWEAGAETVALILERLPFADRNVIAHSHGGQVALFCAARGVAIRTLTTIGTPVRQDVPAAAARPRILFWQHLYDRRCDWVQKLGQFGDGNVSVERRFLLGGVQNYGLDGIQHSRLLRDPRVFHYWRQHGWLTNIRLAGVMEGV